MDLDPRAEARLFGRLAMKGVLPRATVEELFARARSRAEAGEAVSLCALAVGEGLLTEQRLQRLVATDGDELPPIPGHEVLRKLGEGGTANVFLVQRRDGTRLALKVLHEELAADAGQVSAFLAEARLLARLDHPNIVKALKAGRHEGRYLSFLEYVEGRTLQEAIAEGGAFTEEEALSVVLQVARALDHLRQQGVVHRDIKPGNIMVTPANEVKVIDLGFAVEGADGAGAEGTTRGTAAFLSPEQARGQGDLDVRSDIYALGATLYQLVLGELPFSGDDEALVQKAVLEGLSAEATKGGRISAHMHYFIEKMMAKDRDVRYQDPTELMADIERQIEGRKSLDFEEQGGDDDKEMLRRRLARMRRKRGRR
jgi:serine/threonine-protein kinase